MNGVKLAAVALIVAGALALAYGGFSYTSETHQAKVGPLNLSVEETQTVNVPVWAGIGAMLIGGALLVFGSRKN
jgi:LPXTG-motif cell wall-anchored protein